MLKRLLLIILIGILLNFYYKVFYRRLKVGEYVHTDMGYEINELVEKYGYQFEKHNVVTEDDYILEMHRILPNNAEYRGAVLIMHGLVLSSYAFVNSGPQKALAYQLSNEGYDVWLGNARGNEYSRKHLTLDPDRNRMEFFNFTWNEIGIYDIPAKIDYILNATGEEKLFYMGFSQGTVSSIVTLSERPEYNDKIKLWIGLAPVVYTHHCRSLAFRIPAFFQKTLEWLIETVSVFNEILPASPTNIQLMNELCAEQSYTQGVCMSILGYVAGFNNDKLNKTTLPFLMSHMLAGASLKQLLHYTQVLNSNIFRKYDYGIDRNLLIYQQEEPPLYNTQNIRVPMALYYSYNDWLTAKEDIEKLHTQLPTIIKSQRVLDEKFTHLDFLYSDFANDLLYNNIIKLFDEYDSY